MCSRGDSGPVQPMSWLMEESLEKPKGEKPKGEKPDAEKKVYLEQEYTKSEITDFRFKQLVVLPWEIETAMSHNVSPPCHPEAQPHLRTLHRTGVLDDGCAQHPELLVRRAGAEDQAHSPPVHWFSLSSMQKLVTDEDMFSMKHDNFPAPFSLL